MAETATLDPGLRELVRDQQLDAEIAALKELRLTPYSEQVTPEDGEVAKLVEGGKFTITQSHEGKPVPKERIRIYATSDGEPRDVLLYMLSKYLQRKGPNGKPVFSMTPTVPYVTGQVKCILHRDHELRPILDKIGLANRYCEAANIASEFDARLHGENRHPRSWKTWKEYEEKLEKDAEKERWGVLLNKVGGGTPGTAFSCTAEGCTRFFDSEQGLRMHQTKEHRS